MISVILYYYCLLLGIGGAQLIAQQRAQARNKFKIVGFKERLSVSKCEQIVEHHGVKIKKHLPIANACLCEIDTSTATFQSLAADSDVEFIEDDYIAEIQVMPTLSFPFKTQAQNVPWGVKKIGAAEVWGEMRGEKVRVGIIDTGIEQNHPDLKDNIKEAGGVMDCKNIDDDNGHGTHVAGIIAALDNGIGIVGVAPKVEIFSIKAFDQKGRGQVSDIIDALNWCVEKKVHVINMSFGFDMRSRALQRAIRQVHEHNIVMVAAAGNSGGDNSVTYPAKYPEVIAVAACDSKSNVASFSSSGPEVNIIAPGVDIQSTYIGQSYKVLNGTSMACPHVTGAVALLLSSNKVKPGNIRAAVLETAEDIGLPKEQQGTGLVNVRKAVSSIKKNKGGLFSEQIRGTEEGD